jgi:hypothetical protein
MNDFLPSKVFDKTLIEQLAKLGKSNSVKVQFTKFYVSDNKDNVTLDWKFKRLSDKSSSTINEGLTNSLSISYVSAISKLNQVLADNLLDYSKFYKNNLEIMRVDALHSKIYEYFSMDVGNRKANFIDNGNINKTMQFLLKELVKTNNITDNELEFIKNEIKDYTFEIETDNETSLSIFKKNYKRTEFDDLPLYSAENFEKFSIKSIKFYDSNRDQTNER